MSKGWPYLNKIEEVIENHKLYRLNYNYILIKGRPKKNDINMYEIITQNDPSNENVKDKDKDKDKDNGIALIDTDNVEINYIFNKDLSSDKNTIFACCGNNDYKIFLGAANRLDSFIWDKILRNPEQTIQVLTLYTKDIQSNYYLFWDKNFNKFKFYNSYLPIVSRELSIKDLNFMRVIGYFNNEDFNKKNFDSIKKLYVSRDMPIKWVEKKDDKSCPILSYEGAIFWNQYRLTEDSLKQIKNSPCNITKMEFCRFFIPFRHKPRIFFQNIPIVTHAFTNDLIKKIRKNLLSDKSIPLDRAISAALSAALSFYDLLADQKIWIVGIGNPTGINLDNMSNAMSNNKNGVILVTGGPGTGKEAFTKAIHFSDTCCDNSSSKCISTITALDLYARIHDTKSFENIFCTLCKNRCKDKHYFHSRHNPSKVSFIIDELNKVNPQLLSSLLRILENPMSEINCRTNNILFILAASDHLEQLARIPPQDFWTRISYQMRVIHPLGRVTEADAEDFLSSFFWYNWWALSKQWLGIEENTGEAKIKDCNLIYEILGKELADDDVIKYFTNDDKKSLPSIVCETFIQTLTPIAMRDQISIRGLRSIMKQIFTNITWGTRYGIVPCRHKDDTYEASIRRDVNQSIQTVLAILNASRDTPRTPKDHEDMR